MLIFEALLPVALVAISLSSPLRFSVFLSSFLFFSLFSLI